MIVTEDIGIAQREAWADKRLPPVEQVRHGLWSIPVPMPGNPLRYTLVYALAIDDGLALVDVGMNTEESWCALVDGIAETGHHISDVRYAAITHLHPDHFGLAPRLRATTGAVIAMHAAESAALGHFTPVDVSADEEAWRVDLTALGAPPEVVEAERFSLVRFPHGETADVTLEHGSPLGLPGWNIDAVWTPGHTPGHLAFVDRDHDLLFSGDHMLPRISPNISSGPGELDNPLHRYLLSLHATTTLPDCEVLPAHEYRFRGTSDRARQLLDHHEERLTEIRETLVTHPESTAWEITVRVSWSRPIEAMEPRLLRLAVRETQAHLIVLADRGDIVSDGGSPARWTLPARPDDRAGAPA
ncbi:MAG: MBL fold metallo-hydrolase [Rhodococcus sp.]|uniref:MBL fold metallo-hydrolase n=1 Tax=Rhodococcus TaxID=1827 RepID=UPI00169925B6|nr:MULTISPECIES: MBL fold metallo-hydrolase [Rhodococcus]NLV81189.1 MBL fold metallo-hydrolase [Rhodococcus sp. (in: high G+C Gram-positive bacteria)]